MKKYLVAMSLCFCLYSSATAQQYIMIGWNDLGMHCSNLDFSSFVVLPPFNNIRAQVIKVGDATHNPSIMTTDLRVTYEIPGNSYSVGKTNFWSYEDQIFGVDLPDNIGLTGNALTGQMFPVENYFHVTGVPITPYTDGDLSHEDPFQLGLLKVYDLSNQLLATAPPVVPVSNEINCVSSGCHSSAQSILNLHAEEADFDPTQTPILCAGCHSSNALGTPGKPGLPSLSEAIHKHHGERTNDCYKCHPGPNTQCLRDVMKTEHGFTCQTCHGSVTEVGESISDGRIPWLEEPSCGSTACHGSVYAEEPGKLFRESRGHGGLFCSGCHGEPHAIVPSGEARDNVQNIALQGYSGTLNKCAVCHGVVPTGAGPHGLMASLCCVGTRGNIDARGTIDLSDLSLLISYLTSIPSPVMPCPDAANVNGIGTTDLSDLSLLIAYLTTIPRPTLPNCP